MTTGTAAATPDPRLRALDKLVGSWRLHHRDITNGEEWEGQDTFTWMDGGFFLAFHHEEFGTNVKGIMLIGYERRWGADAPSQDLIGHWFESRTGNHLVYVWDVTDHTITCWLEERDAPAAFHGRVNAAGTTITGGWRWDGGGYDLTTTRVPSPS